MVFGMNPQCQIFRYEDTMGLRPVCAKPLYKEKPKPSIEKSTDPAVGWRVWEYKNKYLHSVYKTEFSWPYRIPLTKDIHYDMGIHAVSTFSRALDLLHPYFGTAQFNWLNGRPQKSVEHAKKIPVIGSCYLWGEVKEHSQGYLAEFAYPKELYVAENTDPLTIFQIEEDYGVPVGIREELNRSAWDCKESDFDNPFSLLAAPRYSYIFSSPSIGNPLGAVVTQGETIVVEDGKDKKDGFI